MKIFTEMGNLFAFKGNLLFFLQPNTGNFYSRRIGARPSLLVCSRKLCKNAYFSEKIFQKTKNSFFLTNFKFYSSEHFLHSFELFYYLLWSAGINCPLFKKLFFWTLLLAKRRSKKRLRNLRRFATGLFAENNAFLLLFPIWPFRDNLTF